LKLRFNVNIIPKTTKNYINRPVNHEIMPVSKKILLDTNFLLIPGQFKVDIFSEIERIADFKYKLCVLDLSLKELDNIIEKQKGKDKEAAKLALLLIKSKDIDIIKSKGNYADREILDIADKDFIIATQDASLRKALKNKGTKTIVLRNKKYLIME
jgi:rRNA-processing protein FCF1